MPPLPSKVELDPGAGQMQVTAGLGVDLRRHRARIVQVFMVEVQPNPVDRRPDQRADTAALLASKDVGDVEIEVIAAETHLKRAEPAPTRRPRRLGPPEEAVPAGAAVPV